MAETRDDLIRRALRGGYPGIIEWTDEGERGDWFNSYVTTLLQRDVRDLANVEGLTALPPLLSLLAVRSGSLVNFAELSRSAAIAQSTLKRYVTLFQATFMTDTVPPWSANLSKRLIKAPRLVVTDTGLMSHLARVNRARLDKASSKVAAEDFRGIETLRTVAGKRFHRGVVLYTGRQALPFGPGLHALPISALWRLGANEPRG